MAERPYGKLGTARFYALVFGTAYLLIALVELFYGQADPLQVGDAVILQRAMPHTLIHFAVGIAVFGSFIAGESASRTAARVVGGVFLALTVWGFVAPGGLGGFLGYEGDISMAYNVLHAVTAAAALYAGFVGQRSGAAAAPSRSRTA
ncbi:MAG TPA: DUF4383 domain-containing protein [Actinomycetota bacterium]|nr:DUF4383 domain-containing protein [Actinomycetota bacterium]